MEELFLFVLESGRNEKWSERKTEAGISGGGANPILLGDGPLRAGPISIPRSGVRTTQSQSWMGRAQTRPTALDGGKEVRGLAGEWAAQGRGLSFCSSPGHFPLPLTDPAASTPPSAWALGGRGAQQGRSGFNTQN